MDQEPKDPAVRSTFILVLVRAPRRGRCSSLPATVTASIAPVLADLLFSAAQRSLLLAAAAGVRRAVIVRGVPRASASTRTPWRWGHKGPRSSRCWSAMLPSQLYAASSPASLAESTDASCSFFPFFRARSYTASSSSELSAASKVGLWPAAWALAFALAKQRAAAELVDGSLEPSMWPCRRRGFTPKLPLGHGPVLCAPRMPTRGDYR